MDISRNQYFLAGLIFLFLGIQFRMISTVTLTPEFTQLLAERTGHPLAAVNAATPATTNAATPAATTSTGPVLKKTFRPPDWLGWSFISIGSVLILHSLAMRRPD
jgi:hypothetical protein